MTHDSKIEGVRPSAVLDPNATLSAEGRAADDQWDDWDRDCSPMPQDCDHDDYEVDILEGRARCVCGHSWHQTAAELRREREAQKAWDEECARWEREERSLANRLRKVVNRVRGWWRWPSAQADEIPF